jgi:beta-glucanase (GH16 family)
MVVQALDGSGNPVAGATVNWTTTAGTLSASSSTTDAQGNASVTLTHPSLPQSITVTASVGNVSAAFSQTAHMVLWEVRSPFPPALKPAGPGDPIIAGSIPDDGHSYTLLAGASDEFNGSSLDASKWSMRLPGGYDHYNSELQRYVDSGVSVSDGCLLLTATARPGTTGHSPAPDGSTYPLYDSGVITSKIAYKWGYCEIAFWLPKGKGVWPADWTLARTAARPEIDHLEFVYNGATEFQNMIHGNLLEQNWWSGRTLWADKQEDTQYGFWYSNSQSDYMVADRHTVGVLMDKDTQSATWFFDRKPVVQRWLRWVKNDGSAGDYAQRIVNMAMGDAWATNNWTTPVEQATPQVFKVDYVRTWQRSDQIDYVTA